MDVVKTNIERIGGALDLVNHPGAGMTVRIKIPLTLAIIPALVVTAGGIRYAIPQVSLQELVRLDEEETSRKIEYVYGAPVYRLRGKILPLVFLAEQLGLSEGAKSHENLQVANIVVLRANDKQFGLVVDRVCDTEEIVVKPLGRQLKHLNEYAGATIMGDGAVALILDVLGLASRAGLTGSAHGDSLKGSGDATTSACNDDKESLLIVDFGDSRRFGLPTSAVARLEKFASQKIEWANGHEVIQYRGEILPLVRLSNLFGAAGLERSSTSEARDIDTVVYSENGLACGFIVGKIIDIVATEVKSAARRSDNPHVLGTIVVQDRVTEIVNLPGIARSRVAAQPN